MEEKTITFISKRNTYTIPISKILYLTMKKQEAFIHVADGRVLKTRMTLNEFSEKYGEDFIKLNRGCLVSAMAIYSVDKAITLSNGEVLSYSPYHKKEILSKFRSKQQMIIERLADNDNPSDNEAYHEHYKCFDNIPIAFADIEMVFNDESQAADWVFRYGNEALADLENCPLEKLIGNTFSSIFSNMDKKWLRSYEHSALYGETLEIVDYSPEIDKNLRIICFPTFKGHCGFMLFDITQMRIASDTTVAEKAVLMYLRKMME